MANVNDVARRAGVSTMTVSRALNRPEQVRPQTRDRVLRAVSELEYRPDRRARSLVTGRSETIAVFVPSVLNPFFGRVMHGVTDTAIPSGFNVFLCYAESQEQVERQIEATIGLNVDGVLFFDMAITSIQVLRLKRAGIACVLVDNEFDIPAIPALRTNNTSGGMIATNHLLDLGHRRIAHIHGTMDTATIRTSETGNDADDQLSINAVSFEGRFQRRIWQERYRGFTQALAERSLFPDPALLLQGDGTTEGGVAGGYRAMKTLATVGDCPTAVYAANDLMAIGASNACRDLGLRVPEEVSIVGFDDIDMSALVTPPLTTIRQQRHKLGERAMSILLHLLEHDPEEVEACVEPELVIRSSTGPPSRDGAY